MFGLRISADGRVIEIPALPADVADDPVAVAAITLGAIGADWKMNDPISFGLLNEVTGLVVFAAGSVNVDDPVNLPGIAVLEALEMPVSDNDWPKDGALRDAVWVLALDPGTGRLTDIPEDIAEVVKTAAESAPVEGRAVAAVPDDSAALRALVESLAELPGVSVLTLDASDPAGTLASLAREIGEAPPEVYADGAYGRL